MSEAVRSQEPGLIKSTDSLPLPQTRQGVVDLVRRVLGKPYVEKITIESGQPVEVIWSRTISDLSLIHISEPTTQEPMSYGGVWV